MAAGTEGCCATSSESVVKLCCLAPSTRPTSSRAITLFLSAMRRSTSRSRKRMRRGFVRCFTGMSDKRSWNRSSRCMESGKLRSAMGTTSTAALGRTLRNSCMRSLPRPAAAAAATAPAPPASAPSAAAAFAAVRTRITAIGGSGPIPLKFSTVPSVSLMLSASVVLMTSATVPEGRACFPSAVKNSRSSPGRAPR